MMVILASIRQTCLCLNSQSAGGGMIDPASQAQLKEAIADCIGTDQGVLDALREEIRPLKSATRRIQPRATTSISLVGTDGGNNQLQFDPFLIQLVRVVDSSNNEYCLEAVSPTTPVQKLNERQFAADGAARTALGEMMAFLGVNSLPALSESPRLSRRLQTLRGWSHEQQID